MSSFPLAQPTRGGSYLNNRGDLKFLGDYSAFDLLIEYIDSNPCSGFVAVEVKYTEAMIEPVPDMLRPPTRNWPRPVSSLLITPRSITQEPPPTTVSRAFTSSEPP
jgi:hypothetical protein